LAKKQTKWEGLFFVAIKSFYKSDDEEKISIRQMDIPHGAT
jgi:hypothetical protein